MHRVTLLAFVDELEKLSMSKESAFLRNVGSNLIGTAKAFASPVQGVRRGWAETAASIHPRGGWGARANMALLGVGTAMGLPEVFKKEDPRGMNRSRLARGAGFVGGQVGGLLGAPFGLSGGLAGGIAGEMVGRTAGRVIDKARGIKRTTPPRNQTQGPPQAPPGAVA